MSTLLVFDKSTNESPLIRLSLQQTHYNVIDVIAVDGNGDRIRGGTILSFSLDQGTGKLVVKRCVNVTEDICEREGGYRPKIKLVE